MKANLSNSSTNQVKQVKVDIRLPHLDMFLFYVD